MLLVRLCTALERGIASFSTSDGKAPSIAKKLRDLHQPLAPNLGVWRQLGDDRSQAAV
jgi:hypothetical protein